MRIRRKIESNWASPVRNESRERFSGILIQTLLKHHLIDRMQISIHPLTIGTGKRLFAEGTQAENFKLVDSKISPMGIIFATYEPAGR